MRTRYYYSFNELINPGATGTYWNKLFELFDISITSDTYLQTLYNRIADQHYYDDLLYIDIYHGRWDNPEKPDLADLKLNYYDEVRASLLKIKSWLINSEDRYKILIDLYNEQKDNLLDRIKSEATNQFNDTPQTTDDGLGSDSFATTFTKSTSETDADTIINRLSDINAKWESIYRKWISEFGLKFIIIGD